jgi:formate dehydrogenase subunit delta
MDNRDMIRMANQIAAYFEAYPRGEALTGIANHIRKFWEPRMRKQLEEYVAGGGESLSPLVIAAIAPDSKAERPRASKAKAKA